MAQRYKPGHKFSPLEQDRYDSLTDAIKSAGYEICEMYVNGERMGGLFEHAQSDKKIGKFLDGVSVSDAAQDVIGGTLSLAEYMQKLEQARNAAPAGLEDRAAIFSSLEVSEEPHGWYDIEARGRSGEWEPLGRVSLPLAEPIDYEAIKNMIYDTLCEGCVGQKPDKTSVVNRLRIRLSDAGISAASLSSTHPPDDPNVQRKHHAGPGFGPGWKSEVARDECKSIEPFLLKRLAAEENGEAKAKLDQLMEEIDRRGMLLIEPDTAVGPISAGATVLHDKGERAIIAMAGRGIAEWIRDYLNGRHSLSDFFRAVDDIFATTPKVPPNSEDGF